MGATNEEETVGVRKGAIDASGGQDGGTAVA